MKALSIIAISSCKTLYFPTLSLAADHYGISKYRLLTCYFTDEPADGVLFDLGLDVSDDQEQAARKSWERSRSTSSVRSYHGKPEKKL